MSDEVTNEGCEQGRNTTSLDSPFTGVCQWKNLDTGDYSHSLTIEGRPLVSTDYVCTACGKRWVRARYEA